MHAFLSNMLHSLIILVIYVWHICGSLVLDNIIFYQMTVATAQTGAAQLGPPWLWQSPTHPCLVSLYLIHGHLADMEARSAGSTPCSSHVCLPGMCHTACLSAKPGSEPAHSHALSLPLSDDACAFRIGMGLSNFSVEVLETLLLKQRKTHRHRQ